MLRAPSWSILASRRNASAITYASYRPTLPSIEIERASCSRSVGVGRASSDRGSLLNEDKWLRPLLPSLLSRQN